MDIIRYNIFTEGTDKLRLPNFFIYSSKGGMEMFHLDDVRSYFATETEFTKTKDGKGVELLLDKFTAVLELYPDEECRIKQVIVRTYIDTGENLLIFERAPLRKEYPSLDEVKEFVSGMSDEAYAYMQQMIVCNIC